MALTTVAEAARLLRDRQLSPVELLESSLAAMERWEPHVRSLVAVLADTALDAARAAEREMLDGRHRWPLHGVPIAVKDTIDVAGAPTTAGSKVLARNVATRDAEVVRRLREAGAIVLAKANTHEFALGAATPPTRNPWDTTRIPGGSSGGSAAAVAAGLVPAALGTDSGASIREPAALCGIVGLKPTLGRVSCAGTVPMAWSLDAVGPMATTVEDCRLMLAAMERRDGERPSADSAPARLAGVRIALADELLAPLEDDVRERFSEAVDRLAGAGVEFEHVAIGNVDDLVAATLVIVGAEARAYHSEWLRTKRDLYSPEVLAQLEMAAEYGAVDYVHALRLRTAFARRVASLLESYDAIACPAQAVTAPVAGEEVVPALIRPVVPFAFSGNPALSVPIGLGERTGLPVGLQLVGAHGRDEELLALAEAVDALRPPAPPPEPPAGAPPLAPLVSIER